MCFSHKRQISEEIPAEEHNGEMHKEKFTVEFRWKVFGAEKDFSGEKFFQQAKVDREWRGAVEEEGYFPAKT